jgi:hypothetical protein
VLAFLGPLAKAGALAFSRYRYTDIDNTIKTTLHGSSSGPPMCYGAAGLSPPLARKAGGGFLRFWGAHFTSNRPQAFDLIKARLHPKEAENPLESAAL